MMPFMNPAPTRHARTMSLFGACSHVVTISFTFSPVDRSNMLNPMPPEQNARNDAGVRMHPSNSARALNFVSGLAQKIDWFI